jgi:hypothetical protein
MTRAEIQQSFNGIDGINEAKKIYSMVLAL